MQQGVGVHIVSYKVGINFFPTALAFFKQLPLHKPLGLFTLVAISSCLQLSHAQVSPLFPDDIYADERARFLILEKSLRTLPKRRLEDLDEEIYGLANYPLYPYLLRLRLERTMSLKTQREVEQFLEDYAGQPVSYGLRYRWLNYLSSRGHENAFLSSYRDGMGAKLTCQALGYKLKRTDDPKPVLTDVDPLWYSGQSQPDECDPLFAKWRSNGLMTPDKVVKRIAIAAKEDNRRIIPYLKRQLPTSHQYLADAWSSVSRDVSLVNRTRLFPLKHKNSEAEILTWGIEKLAWRNPKAAIKAYNTYAPKNIFSVPELHIIQRAIALSATLDFLPEAHEWLDKADIAGASDDVKLWHVSFLLRGKQWQRVVDVIDAASSELQQQENFRYWKARALEELGNVMQATVMYKQLANERNYYGFMASARINSQPNLAHTPAPLVQSAVHAIANTPATQRAMEFYRLERSTSARREWRYLLSNLPDSQVTDAGVLAYEWGIYDQAIISFAKSGYWDDVERRFPLAFESQFSEKSETYDVSKAFAMAIARRESSFMVDAVSPVGAAGLMQLMPGTAQYLAKKKVSRNTLFQVENNLDYGVQYLRYLGDKLDNNPVLVSASYNAGWRKVLEWLPAGEALPVDIWIENIPYKETRSYVKAVLAYQYIYEHQLGENKNVFPQLTQDVIPSSSAVSTHPVTGTLQLAPH
jgi:soluble lytic murein transglycosylase